MLMKENLEQNETDIVMESNRKMKISTARRRQGNR